MESVATINVRMPENLKRNGGKVLERNRVSPTELVRSVYRYMEQNQAIPECLDIAADNQKEAVQSRRLLLRRIAGTIDFGGEVDVKQAREERIAAKYGNLL